MNLDTIEKLIIYGMKILEIKIPDIKLLIKQQQYKITEINQLKDDLITIPTDTISSNNTIPLNEYTSLESQLGGLQDLREKNLSIEDLEQLLDEYKDDEKSIVVSVLGTAGLPPQKILNKGFIGNQRIILSYKSDTPGTIYWNPVEKIVFKDFCNINKDSIDFNDTINKVESLQQLNLPTAKILGTTKCAIAYAWCGESILHGARQFTTSQAQDRLHKLFKVIDEYAKKNWIQTDMNPGNFMFNIENNEIYVIDIDSIEEISGTRNEILARCLQNMKQYQSMWNLLLDKCPNVKHIIENWNINTSSPEDLIHFYC